MTINSYKDLIVWQKVMELAIQTYELTDNLPTSEKFGLISQMNRCAISIPSNIAEGSRRGSRKDFKNFLTIAFGSGAELETQITLLKNLKFSKGLKTDNIENLLSEVMKMLNSMRQKLS